MSDTNIDDLRAELSSLQATVTELKEQQAKPFKRPLIDRLGAWGGFLALLVALATGAVTFWDDVVLRGERQEERQVAQLREWLNELSSITAQIQQAQASGNMQTAGALMSSFGPTKDRLIRAISDVYRERPDLFTERDVFMLSMEALGFGDKKSADKLMDDILARGVADNNPAMLAEIKWNKARIRGLPGDMHAPVEARTLYAEAVDLTHQMAPGTMESVRMQMLVEWLQFETTASGDCARAHTVLDMAFNEIENENLPMLMIQQFQQTLFTTLDGAPTRCDLPRG